MKHYYDPETSDLYAYSDEQVENGIVKDGLMQCPTRPSVDHVWINSAWELSVGAMPTKEERIVALQAIYESDLSKLSQAWLAALIADGSGEAARHAAIKVQMEELAAQLDTDILEIILEE